MQLGMIGLGRMGGNMTQRLRRGGHDVIGYDTFSPDTDAATLEELISSLTTPRLVWVMVPAGDPTEDTIQSLRTRLSPGDLVVDGGNSRFTDSQRRAAELAAAGIGFVDAGVSGGIWGLDNGYALMVGGEREHVQRLWPVLATLAPATDDGTGLAHVGPVGAGHFTKMVHNGVEYALMQAYAEGFELLARHPVAVDVPAALKAWQTGSVVRSWLLDLLVTALEAHPRFDDLDDVAPDSGEGRWTIHAAIETGVPVPAIAAAVNARLGSQLDASMTMKAVAALREQFGGHAVVPAGVPAEVVPEAATTAPPPEVQDVDAGERP